MGRGFGPGSGGVGWCYVCVRCESGFSPIITSKDVSVVLLKSNARLRGL